MLKQRTLSKNILVNMLLQITVICSGLIIPRLIIGAYGSETNGVISSITQFLSYITLLEAGIGGVIKAELYGPLLRKDSNELGKIIVAVERFYRKIGGVFILYIAVLAVIYEKISNTQFDWFFTASLVIILGISSLIQYFFGITYQTLLQADQKYWLTSGIQIATILLNIILSIVLIQVGASVHMVKLMTAFVFCLRPLILQAYVKKNYCINRNVIPDKKTLAQRWDGFGHHIAYFIHSNTDVVILTVFATMTEVSVYSVYSMIVVGLRSLVNAVSSAVEPFIGNKVADKNSNLIDVFGVYSYCNSFTVSILFTAAAILIIPFVSLYTAGVNDADYIRPLFACFLVISEGVYCLRSPYSVMIFASGHFKQTKRGAFIEAGINIVISLLLVKPLGIIGVAIGTAVSMLFRTTEYAYYLSKNIIYVKFDLYIRRIFAIAISAVVAAVFCKITLGKMLFQVDSYFAWICSAVLIVLVVLLVNCFVFFVFFPSETKKYCTYIKNRKTRMEISDMRELNQNEAKMIMMEILKDINTYCQREKIKFYLTGGTLLGAVRHKGFIPWDDDIDIAMMRKDYDRFIKEFESKSGKVKILSRHTDEKYRYAFAKAIDVTTLVIEDEDDTFPIGIYVDIFPLDFLGNDLKLCKKIVKRLHRWHLMYQLKYLHIDKKRDWKKNLLLIFIHPFLKMIPDTIFLSQIEKVADKFSAQSDSMYIANLCGAWGEKEITLRSNFSSSVDLQFEDGIFPAPIGYDAFLRDVYHDYMKLPPIEKQVSHHNYKAYQK